MVGSKAVCWAEWSETHWAVSTACQKVDTTDELQAEKRAELWESKWAGPTAEHLVAGWGCHSAGRKGRKKVGKKDEKLVVATAKHLAESSVNMWAVWWEIHWVGPKENKRAVL